MNRIDTLTNAEHPALERLKRLNSGWVVASAASAAGQKLYRDWRERTSFSVAVPDDDDIYPALVEWVLERIPDRRRRSLLARTRRRSGRGDLVEAGPSPRAETKVSLAYDGSRATTVDMGGHRVHIRVQEGQINPRNDGPFMIPGRIVFTAANEAGRDEIVKFVRDVAEANRRAEAGPRLYIAGRWGGWNRRADLPARDLDTVILRAGQKEAIVDDLETFLAAEEDYKRLGVPWHRGILLEGPSGSGKTSLARALADRFDMDVYYLPLSDVQADASLLHMLSEVPARSMLLLEDIDVVHAATRRDDAESSGISMSGLLNALDGVASPWGSVVVMTTNHLDALDEAIIRPGRADRIFHIGNVDADQINQIVATMTGHVYDFPEPLEDRPVKPAEVVEAIRSTLGQPAESMVKAVVALLG